MLAKRAGLISSCSRVSIFLNLVPQTVTSLFFLLILSPNSFKMKVLKGKTMRKLKDKITTTTTSKKRKSKPIIRKIADGEDLVTTTDLDCKPPTSAAYIVGDIKELETTSDYKPSEIPDSLSKCSMDQSPAKTTEKQMVDMVPSQLLTVEAVPEEELVEEKEDGASDDDGQEGALWKFEEPEIGDDIPDQDHPGFLEIAAASTISEDHQLSDHQSDEDENEDENDLSFDEYTEFNGKAPVAVIGNIMLVSAEKETPMSPFSTAPTEPVTPEEALKRSFEVDSMSDDDSFAPKFIPKTTTYSIPNDEESKSLWNRLERNVELSQNLLKDFNCESHVEKTVNGLGCTIVPQQEEQSDNMAGVEITVTEPQPVKEHEELGPRDEEQRRTIREAIVKPTYLLDDAQFQVPSDDDTEHNHHQKQLPIEQDNEELEASVLTVRMGNSLNTSFEMPFDQQLELARQLAPPVVTPMYVPPQVADEEEFPDDEMNQEAIDFFQEIEDNTKEDQSQDQGTYDKDSAFISATLSVANSVRSVADGVTTDSVVSMASVTAQTVASVANSLDEAAAPTLDTIFEKTSAMTPTAFDGFFDNPKPAKRGTNNNTATKQRQDEKLQDESFNSDNYSYDVRSEDAQTDKDAESVESRYGFDKTMDGWFSSETFAAVTRHVPNFVMQLVVDDDARSDFVEAQ